MFITRLQVSRIIFRSFAIVPILGGGTRVGKEVERPYTPAQTHWFHISFAHTNAGVRTTCTHSHMPVLLSVLRRDSPRHAIKMSELKTRGEVVHSSKKIKYSRAHTHTHTDHTHTSTHTHNTHANTQKKN